MCTAPNCFSFRGGLAMCSGGEGVSVLAAVVRMFQKNHAVFAAARTA